MKKTKQITIKVNDIIYTKIQELKSNNVNISKTILNILLKASLKTNYLLSDKNCYHPINIRLDQNDYEIIQKKYTKPYFTYTINAILENKLECLTNAQKQKLKRNIKKQKEQINKLIENLKQLIC